MCDIDALSFKHLFFENFAWSVCVFVFKTNNSTNYGGQFVLAGVFLSRGPALEWLMYHSHSIEENWCSLSRQQAVPVAPLLGVRLCVPVLSSMLGFLSGLNLNMSCACSHNVCEFIYASVLLCLENTISWLIIVFLPLLHISLSLERKDMMQIFT